MKKMKKKKQKKKKNKTISHPTKQLKSIKVKLKTTKSSTTAPELKLFIPGRLPGLNELIDASKIQTHNYSKYARLKRQWTNYIIQNMQIIQAVNLDSYISYSPKLNDHIFKPPDPGPLFHYAWFDFTWIEPNRKRDPDNIAAGGRKLILDTLTKVKFIRNDGWRNVAGWTDALKISADNPGVEIIIKEVKQ